MGGTYAGKSYNVFNATEGKWQQFWVDNQGGVLEFVGDYVPNEMRYTGVSKNAKGETVLHRMTFFSRSKDELRQLWEQSDDGGKSWTVAFDGTYRRETKQD